MKKLNVILKNYVFLLTGNFLSKVISLLTFSLLAKYLGPDKFGSIALAFAFSKILGVFLDLGFNTYSTKKIVENPRSSNLYLGTTFLIRILLGFFFLGILALILKILNYPYIVSLLILLIYFSTYISSLHSSYFSIYQALERMEFISLMGVSSSLFLLFFTVLGIKLNVSLPLFGYFFILNSIIFCFLNFFLCKRKFKIYPKIHKNLIFVKNFLSRSFPLGISFVFITGYYYIDSIMLSKMSHEGIKSVGWYNASYKLIIFLIGIFSLYITAIFPFMVKTYKSGKEKIRELFEKNFVFISFISIPIIILFYFLSPKVINLLFGSLYKPSILILKILLPSVFLASIGGITGHLLIVSGKYKTLAKITGTGFILNLIGNAILIPKFSYIGASITTDITRFFIVIVEMLVLRRNGMLFYKKTIINFFFLILIGFCSFGLILLTNNKTNNLFFSIFLGIIIYFGITTSIIYNKGREWKYENTE